MESKSMTDIGRDLFNQAFEFKLVMHKDKISVKLSACGHDYITDLDREAVKNDKAMASTWLNLFHEFELDLDAGVNERKERIIRPESNLIGIN